MTETENVATYARIRPYNPAINEDKRLTARAVAGTKILNQHNDKQDTYNFTRVYDMKESTDDLFETGMRPLLDYKILQGINSIFIVYGQSGSGKSFTLIGEDGHLGVLPMSLQYLLSKDKVQRIDIASIEAYGIKAAKIGFYDLVAQLEIKEKAPKQYDAYTTKDNSRLNTDNAKMIQITNDNCLQIITQLQEVSHMAPTLKNPHSSRGHTCYFCRIKMTGLEDVYFIAVDLAGSEGQTALGTKDEFVTGLQLAMSKGKLKLNKKQMKGFEQMYKIRSLEAGCINNGLTQLQCIFGELIKKRISKAKGLGLRKVLSSFISLKSAYAILFTLSASANNNKVTRATLNFAKQTQLVKVDTQKAKAKIDKDAIIKELNDLIEQLKKELGEKDTSIKDLQQQIKDGSGGSGDDDGRHFLSVHEKQPTFLDIRLETIRREISEAEEEEAKWTLTIDPNIDESNMSEHEMREIFDKFDEDGGGSIDEKELQHALKELGHDLNEEEVENLFNEIDTNGDGEIDFDEFKVMVGQTWFINAFQNRLLTNMEKMMSRLTVLDDGDEENEENEYEYDDDEKEFNNKNNNNKNKQELMDEIKDKMQRIEELQNEVDRLKSICEGNEELKSNNDGDEKSTYGLLSANNGQQLQNVIHDDSTDVVSEMQEHEDVIDSGGGCGGYFMRVLNKFNNKNAYRKEPTLYHRFA